jgi:hypothetical protein
MKIKKCKTCGFPVWFARALVWNDNGTISSKYQKDFHSLIIEADYLTEIFKRIEEVLGVSIQHIVFEAQRNAAGQVIDITTMGALEWLKKVPGGPRLVIQYMNRLSMWTGQSFTRSLLYSRKGVGEALVRNPFNRELMAAVICGALESLGGFPYRHTWRKTEKGEDVIVVIPEPDRPEISDRLSFTIQPSKPGNRRYERCPGCGVPVLLRGLAWKEKDGVIMDTRRGVRVVFLEVYTANVVFRELARELGEEIYPIIVEAQRDFSLDHIRKEFLSGRSAGIEVDKDALYRDALDTLALRGQGNPVMHEMESGKLTVTIENPFNEHVLAGYLSALFELAEDRVPEVNWESADPSTITFSLK